MSTQNDYADIASKAWDEVQEIKLLPVGSYLLTCRGGSIQAPKSADGSSSAMFTYEVSEAMDDVDMAELGADYDLSGNRIFARFWLKDANDLNRLRKHILAHGVDVKGMSIDESIKVCKNMQVVAYINTRNYTTADGNAVTENVANNFQQPA